jgi:hypothetical protein
MNEAVRTTASPAAIWVIVIVMSIMTAILVSAASIADSWQARAGSRARGAARLGASVGDLINHDGALGQDKTSSGVPQPGTAGPGEAWSQTRDGAAGAGEPAPTGERVSGGPVPGQRSAGEQEPVQPQHATRLPAGEQPAGRHRPTDPATPETERVETEMAATITAAEAPTRSDLPPVPGGHSMPAQRRADIDRAERTPTGTGTQADEEEDER